MASYSLEQLHRYYDRVGLPQVYRQSSVAQKDEQVSLQFLKLLQRYQLAAVPFENLNLHYSAHRTISIDYEQVFDKIVDNKSHRGGYCMENSTLFGTLLRTLGYNVTTVGGRVNEAVQPMAASKSWKGPTYDGWYDPFLLSVPAGYHDPVAATPRSLVRGTTLGILCSRTC